MFAKLEGLIFNATGSRFVAVLPKIVIVVAVIFLLLRLLPAGRAVAARLLQAIPTLFVMITGTFFMLRFTPGGPFSSEKAV
jgi:ABC-type dipeptide/oligopeptide/nickel transport system permease component